jgi:hypothetical protein
MISQIRRAPSERSTNRSYPRKQKLGVSVRWWIHHAALEMGYCIWDSQPLISHIIFRPRKYSTFSVSLKCFVIVTSAQFSCCNRGALKYGCMKSLTLNPSTQRTAAIPGIHFQLLRPLSYIHIHIFNTTPMQLTLIMQITLHKYNQKTLHLLNNVSSAIRRNIP